MIYIYIYIYIYIIFFYVNKTLYNITPEILAYVKRYSYPLLSYGENILAMVLLYPLSYQYKTDILIEKYI